jgi:DNA-binding transcriptional ArsR family regulator
MVRRDVFQAIADPTRRDIIGLLSQKSYNLNSVVDRFNVSRPAIAKHLKILEQCGLIVVRKEGRENFYEARLQRLREVSDWSQKYKVFWSGKLDALAEFLKTDKKSEGTRSKNKNKTTRTTKSITK